MRQTTKSANEITTPFYEKSVSYQDYVAIEAMKMSKYCSILRDEIRECMSISRCQTHYEMIRVARLREIELEMHTKLKRSTPNQMTSQP